MDRPRSWQRSFRRATFTFITLTGVSPALFSQSPPQPPKPPTMTLQIADGDKEVIQFSAQGAFDFSLAALSTAARLSATEKADPALRNTCRAAVLTHPSQKVASSASGNLYQKIRPHISFVRDRTDFEIYEVPPRKSFTLGWTKKTVPQPKISYFNLIDDPEGHAKEPSQQTCGAITIPTEGTSKTIFPAQLRCLGKPLRKGLLFQIELQSSGKSYYAHIYVENTTSPFFGESLGFAVTYVDQWDESSRPDAESDEGFRINTAGAGLYYSLASLRTKRVRWITNVLAMDLDPDVDLELGLGTGLMFKITEDQGSKPGFGLAAGLGYNFMVDKSDQAWFTFIGLTVEIGGKGKDGKK